MKQSYFLRTKEVFPGIDIVCNYSFKAIGTRDNCALLARASHHLAMDFAITGERSVFLQKKDCFECLSPYTIAA